MRAHWLAFAYLLCLSLRPAAALPPDPPLCPHLAQLAAAVTASGGRLALGQVARGDIARLFAHLGMDLPARLAAADRAAVVYVRDRRGRAVIVLFEKGCALAALRLPAAVALGALGRLTGEEI